MKMKLDDTRNLKATLILLAFFILNSFNVKSQNSFTLPDGYHTSKDFAGKEIRGDGDFDGDGVSDLAIVCADQNDSKIIVVYLASKWLVDQSYWWFPWDYASINLKYSNKVLDISSSDFGGHQFIELKLKYYANLSNMKLIGYKDESNVRNPDGEMVQISSKNINLNTGEYEMAGVKRKINIDLITLSNIEKYFNYLSSVGENYNGN